MINIRLALNNPASWKTMEALGGQMIKEYFDDEYSNCIVKDYKINVDESIEKYSNIYEEQIEKFTEWMNDFQVSDYIGRSGEITTLLGEKEWLENSAKNNESRSFNIIDLNNDKLVGTVGLERFNWIARSAVLGIFIGDEDYRSNGYGTEAIKLLLEYGFKYLNLHSIRLDLLSVNERAHKCYLKCGFKDTGKSREGIFLNGKYYDKLHMDILESEFEGSYIKNKNV